MLERKKCERDEEVVGVMSNAALKEYVFLFFFIWIDEEVSEGLSFPLADVCMTWADGIKWVGRWCRRCSQASLWIEWQGRRWKGRFVTTLPGDIGLSLLICRSRLFFFHPFVCLSPMHLSFVLHQLFTRSKWIFQGGAGLSSSIPHALIAVSVFISLLAAPPLALPPSPFHGSSLGAFVQYISMCYSWSQFCGVCKGFDFGLVLWPAFCPCSPFITSASCESACEWWLPADTCTPSSSVPGVFGGKINGRGVWSDGLLGL